MSKSEVKPVKRFFNKIQTRLKNTITKAKIKISSVFGNEESQNGNYKSPIKYSNSLFERNTSNNVSVDTTEFSDSKYKNNELGKNEKLSNLNPITMKENTAVLTPILSRIIGKISSSLGKDTKDGEIGYTKQGNIGDCWLLSAINALSYTEQGKELIKKALEHKEDGTLVHFKGIGDYFVSNKMLNTAKGSLKYAYDDDDMIILELAAEAALDDVSKGKIITFDNTPIEHYYLKSPTYSGHSILHEGRCDTIIYLLSGKTSNLVDTNDNKEEFLNTLKQFEENSNKDMSMILRTKHSPQTVSDIHGKNVKIYEEHSYAVKKVSNNTVTLVNPWNSKKVIELDIKKAVSLFDGLYITDLSDNNPVIKSVIPDKTSVIKDENGNKIENMFDKEGNLIREIKYGKFGKKISMHTKFGNRECTIEYDKLGIVKKYTELIKTSSGEYIRTECEYSKNAKITKRHEVQYNENGKKISEDYWESPSV